MKITKAAETGIGITSANRVSVVDAGGYYTGTNLETILTEIAGGSVGAYWTPYRIASGETFTVPIYKQVLFEMVIDNQGILVVDGFLIMVS